MLIFSGLWAAWFQKVRGRIEFLWISRIWPNGATTCVIGPNILFLAGFCFHAVPGGYDIKSGDDARHPGLAKK